MGLGTTFPNLSLDLAISMVPRSQGPLVSERFCGPLAELRQQWDSLLKNLPERILSTTEFRGFVQRFRSVLCESSPEILCRDLIGVANSASSWEELATFREQVLQWALAQACSKSLKASASRALRELSGNPNSLSESVQFLAHDIGRHPVRLSLLAGIGAAGFGMRMGRLAGAVWAQVRGFGAVGQFVARSSVGLGAELSFFSVGTRAAHLAQGKKIDWSISSVGQEIWEAFWLLGPMKLINPLGHLGRVTGGLRLLQAGTAHFAGASVGTWASALANRQDLSSYQIFSGATHLMIEGAIASGLLSTGLPGLEAAHRALDLKTRSMLRQSMRTAWSQAKGFLDRSFGEMKGGLQEAWAMSNERGVSDAMRSPILEKGRSKALMVGDGGDFSGLRFRLGSRPQVKHEIDFGNFTIKELRWFFDFIQLSSGTRPEELTVVYTSEGTNGAIRQDAIHEWFEISLRTRHSPIGRQNIFQLKEVRSDVIELSEVRGGRVEQLASVLRGSPAYIDGNLVFRGEQRFWPGEKITKSDLIYLDNRSIEALQSGISKAQTQSVGEFVLLRRNGKLHITRDLSIPALGRGDFYFRIRQVDSDPEDAKVQKPKRFLVSEDVNCRSFLEKSYVAIAGTLVFPDSKSAGPFPMPGEMAILKIFRRSVRSHYGGSLGRVRREVNLGSQVVLANYYNYGRKPKIRSHKFLEMMAEVIGKPLGSREKGKKVLHDWGFDIRFPNSIAGWSQVTGREFKSYVSAVRRLTGDKKRGRFGVLMSDSTTSAKARNTRLVLGTPPKLRGMDTYLGFREFQEQKKTAWLAELIEGGESRETYRQVSNCPAEEDGILVVRSEGWVVKKISISKDSLGEALSLDLDGFQEQVTSSGTEYPDYFILRFGSDIGKGKFFALQGIPIEEFDLSQTIGHVVMKKNSKGDGYSIFLTSGNGAKTVARAWEGLPFITVQDSAWKNLSYGNYKRVFREVLGMNL